ncbi:hypothetical protein [Sphingobacterium detergens]
MKIPSKWLSLMLSVITTNVFSQGTTINNKIILPDFQNPSASSLGKYGVYPTAEYTGALPISIPLFEIDAKGYKVPISLSFHGSGIKLYQKETEVGLGWSLSGLGVISRSVMGVPDEKPNGSARVIPKTGPEIWDNAMLPVDASQSDISAKRGWLKAMSEGAGEDTHTDYYFYNFPGHSGKFIVTNKTEYKPVPFAPVKIERGPISNDLYNSSVFKITDEVGAVSTFGSWTYSTPENFEPLSRNAVIGSWYLDQIAVPYTNENINFVYEDFFIDESTAYQEQSFGYRMAANGSLINIEPFINTKSGKLTHRMKLIKEISFGEGAINFNYIASPDVNVSTMKFLNEILIYNKSNILVRRILFDYTVPANRVKLSKITTTDLVNPANSGVHEIVYNAINFPPRSGGMHTSDYWGYYNNKGMGLIAQKTIQRSSINLSADGEGSWQDYKIYVGDADRSVNESVNQAEMISKLIYPTKGYTTFEFETNKYLNRELISQDEGGGVSGVLYGKGSNQKSEATYPFTFESSGYFIKKPNIQIEFGPPTPPNGAGMSPYNQFVTLTDLTDNQVIYTQYHNSNPNLPLTVTKDLDLVQGHKYELKLTVYGVSTYLNGYMTSSIDAVVSWRTNRNEYGYIKRPAGGLRIKKLENFDSNSVLTSSEEYVYGKDGNDVGKGLFQSDIFLKDYQDFKYYTFFQRFSGTGSSPTETGRFWERKYFGVAEYSSIGLNGSPVFYDYVTKLTNSTNSTEKIKEVRQYQLNNEVTFNGVEYLNAKNYGAYVYLLNNPVLVNEFSYDSKDKLVRSRFLDYKHFKQDVHTPALVFEQNIFVDPSSPVSGGYQLSYNVLADFRVTGSNIRRDLFLPILEQEKIYFYKNDVLADSTSVVKNTDYNSVYNVEPSEIKISRSNGQQRITKFKYPDDIASTTLYGGNLNTAQLQSIHALNRNNEHRVLEPVQIEKYTNNNSLVSIDRNLYGNLQGKARLNKILNKYSSENFVDKLTISNYDSYGNPLAIEKDEGINVVYLWGYNGKYPIAEIKNATYAEVVLVLTQATIDNLNVSTHSEATMETLIKNAADKLRSDSRLSKSMVTSYTYKPLVGMTSKTDARGVKETYKYDGMQRLQAILDQVGNVTKAIDYHYRSN